MKLFVCGSRTITNKDWIFEKLDECVEDNGFSEITVLEGEAKGVDLIAKEWAISRNIPVKEYPIDMETYGFKAPFVRNEQMAKDCDYMVAFWNGTSTGTQHDIEMARKYGKLRKIYFERTPEWIEGHDPSSYFWIYPCTQNENNEWRLDANTQDQISIEEDIVHEFLYRNFLGKYFDSNIKYICRIHSIEAVVEYDQYDHNLYTYETVRKMCEDMKTKYSGREDDIGRFYLSLADRLLLMMERNPNFEFITFEGP